VPEPTPVGPTAWRPDADAWLTAPICRTVLAVAHNVTAAARLLDVLPTVAVDRRVQLLFTCIGASAFTDGTDEYLRRHHVCTVPWDQALAARPNLAIAASYGGKLHLIDAPLIVLPHGVGYNKYKPSSHQAIKPSSHQVFGLSAEELLHDGRLVPTAIVLSHDEQLDRLRDAVPSAVPAAVVAGDPCYDALVASRPQREGHRQALGVGGGQRLVLVASTWGPDSLYGRDPSLPARLAGELPLDRYRVAVALHPNVTAAHSRWQLDLWLADCAKAGALVLRDEGLWRQAVVAADLVVGDHGSVTCYAAALGTPVLLGAWPEGAVAPGSPAGRLLALAPRLGPGRGLRDQVDRAVDRHDPARYAPVAELTTSRPGEAGDLLRTLAYELLRLPGPHPPPPPVALPLPRTSAVDAGPDAQVVEVSLEAGDPAGSGNGRAPELVATVTRYGLAALTRRPAVAGHLVADARAANTRLPELADVVVHPTPLDAARWATETLRALPGCAVAMARAADGTWLAATDGGPAVRFTVLGSEGTDGADAAEDPATPTALASTLHAWLVAGGAAEDVPPVVRVRLAGREVTARATPQSAASLPSTADASGPSARYR
jgi:hypothetical protein